MSKVSIIITTYNQASFVLQAVRSLLAQTWRDFEIFVVDDGSTDHTADLFAMKLDSLSYIQQPHQGLRAGWLRGLSASTGDFLVFMHADELLPPRRLELQVQQLEAEPELGLVYFGRQPLVEGATHILRAAGDQGDNLLDDPLVALEFFLSGCPLIRRECVEKAGLLETPISLKDEWNPWKKIAFAGYKVSLKERLIRCREHIAIFLQNLHRGEMSMAQRHLTEAVRVFPELLNEPAAFVESVLEYAKRPDVNDPIVFAQVVLANLSKGAPELQRCKSHILAKLSMARAFQEFWLGNMTQVRRNVWEGITHDPSNVTNTGVISIFSRSLLRRNGESRTIGGFNKDFGLPPSVVARVQDALGHSVRSIERTVDGTGRNTYLIRGGGRPCILKLAKGLDGNEVLYRVTMVMERVHAVGVPVPSVLASSFPTPDSRELAWVVEEWMPGYGFRPQNMRWRDTLSVAAELGRNFRRFHSIEALGFGKIKSERLDADHSSFDRWLAGSILSHGRTLERLPVEFRPCIEAASQFLLETYPAVPKLCHGDINSGNVLVSGGHLTALIDWFDLCGCDPAFDVAIFHFWESDEQILSALLEAYTPEEPILFRRRIAANVICYAAYLLTTDWKPTMDKTPAHRQCLKWLAEGESMAF